MGKYMKKSKITANVLPMEVPQSTNVGVCTRAKSLALKRLQSSASDDASSYLELRSRRLKKVVSVSQRHQKPTSTPPKQSELNAATRSSPVRSPTGSRQNSVSVEPKKGEASSGNMVATEAGNDFDLGGVEASTGDGNLAFLTKERVTRGSTNHRSTTPNGFLRDMPSFRELEEFFARVEQEREQEQQRKFMEKYNFDIVAEKPLPGRYEWFRVSE